MVHWIQLILLATACCISSGQYSFYVQVGGSWSLYDCDEGTDNARAGVQSIDFALKEDTQCTCLLYNPDWIAEDTIMVQRLAGSWDTVREYRFDQWDGAEGGALRVELETDIMYIYKEPPRDSLLRTTSTLKIRGNNGGSFTLQCSTEAISYTTPGQPTTTTTPSTTTTITTPTTTTTTPTTTTPQAPPISSTQGQAAVSGQASSTTPLPTSTTTKASNGSNAGITDAMVSTKDKESNRTLIIAVAVSATAVIMVCLIIVCILANRRRKNKAGKNNGNRDTAALTKGDLEEDQGSSGYQSVSAIAMDHNKDYNRIEKQEAHIYRDTNLSSLETHSPKSLATPSPKHPVPKKSPKISMNTKPAEDVEYDSADESNATDDDKSSNQSSGIDGGGGGHSHLDSDGKSLHAEDIEFVGHKHNHQFRKVKKHKSRSTILRGNHNKAAVSDSDTESAKDFRHDDTENTEVEDEATEVKVRDEGQTTYADIDLTSLSNRNSAVDSTTKHDSKPAKDSVYADIDFS